MWDVLVECGRCRRPVAGLSHTNGVVEVVGLIQSEDHDPARAMRVDYGSTRRQQWNAEVYGSGEQGRRTLVCIGKRHPEQRLVVRQSTLQQAFDDAQARGRKRISTAELSNAPRKAPR